MVKVKHAAAIAMSLMLAAALFVPGIASAQLRDFEGKVDSISDSKIIVDNRKGDKISFDKTGETTVEGKATAWDAVKKGDWVAVGSKMMEKPRKAYKVTVKDPPADAAVDE
jgi:hypothetical protein